MAVNIIVEAVVIAVVRSAVKVVAVDRSEVVDVAAALVVVSYLKLFCPLSCLLLFSLCCSLKACMALELFHSVSMNHHTFLAVT